MEEIKLDISLGEDFDFTLAEREAERWFVASGLDNVYYHCNKDDSPMKTICARDYEGYRVGEVMYRGNNTTPFIIKAFCTLGYHYGKDMPEGSVVAVYGFNNEFIPRYQWRK